MKRSHLLHGHKEGDVRPLEFRVVTFARDAPIDPPYGKGRWFQSRNEPKLMTEYVSENLGPVVLQYVGPVVYRATEPEAREAERAVHELLDARFPEPVTTDVERWNEDLDVWQQPDQAGGDKASLRALGWEVRIRHPDKSIRLHHSSPNQRRGGGDGRRVATGRHFGLSDESSARTIAFRWPDLARGKIRVRPMTRLRRRILFTHLYDRRERPKDGWLRYEEPDGG